MLKQTNKFINIGLLLALVILMSSSFLGVHRAAADGYSYGEYGTCSYDCTPATQTTLPSGLEVNINLKNGQVIPRQGYEIIVTPLNGQGSSFERVDFYINGLLVNSQPPAQDGTAEWFWNPQQYPGTDVKIVITGQNGEVDNQEFNVTIASTEAVHNNSTAASPSVIQQIVQAPGQVLQSIGHSARQAYRSTERFIKKLPPARA